MPIHPQCALALLPKQIDHAAAGIHLSQEARLVISSVGMSLNCERVVVHPEIIAQVEEDELISVIRSQRKAVDKQIDAAKNLKETVQRCAKRSMNRSEFG